MAASVTDGLYYSYNIPLGLFNLIQEAISHTANDPNTPQVQGQAAPREWFSQPRPGNDDTTEVLTTNFTLPLSLSEIGFELLRVSCRIEVWYQDRQNNWRQVLDESRIPVALDMSTSNAASWYKAHFYCYPIVAKAVQFRITRRYDQVVGNRPYCVGVRNGLLRRNIYERSDGTLGIEPQQDILGNTINSYIKDWDSPKAIDNNPNTFWRSMPIPDPRGIANLYLDCRLPDGSPQLIDTLYIDPVYTGQQLNLYYSNDDTEGTLKLSPVTAQSTLEVNNDWRLGVGRWDTSVDPGDSNYRFPMAWGPLVSQPVWFGIEWAPDFDPTDGPAQDPILLQVTPTVETEGQFTPTVYYDVGAGEIVLRLTDGTTIQSYTAALSPILVTDQPLRIVVGWRYDPMEVFISVKLPNGTEIATMTDDPDDLPHLMSLDGSVGFENFRGLMTAHVIKLEDYTTSSAAFQANPKVYVAPDPVMPDPSGVIPPTTLDNAIYAASWSLQQHGTGGGHGSRYDTKTWTPIWRDYLTAKGKLYFPQQINLKYLKMEFTSLAEEPYPVYDAGVQTSYQIFPVSISQEITRKHLSISQALAGLGHMLNMLNYGWGTVNWLNPQTVNDAINSIFGPVVHPLQVVSGPGTTVTSLPTTTTENDVLISRDELASPSIYRRTYPDADTLASYASWDAWQRGQYWWSVLGEAYNQAIWDAQQPMRDHWTRVGTGQVSGWGQVVDGVNAINETLWYGRPPTTETRLRFNTTSVHRYDIRTVTRTEAVAYFAGIAEVQPYLRTPVAELDPVQFTFDSYNASQWSLTNVRALDSGPISTMGSVYEVVNPGFDLSIANWTQVSGDWEHDSSDTHGHWHKGSATVIADGTEKVLRSTPVDVAPGAHLDASVWVNWEGLTAADESPALQLHALYYLNDTLVDTEVTSIDFDPWEEDGDWTQITASLLGGTGFTVPTGVNKMRLALVVTEDATAGQVWFDTVEIDTTDAVQATAFKNFVTTSTFTKVRCEFADSGVVRSNSMWARLDPLDLNIDATALAYYTTTIPDVVPAGMWGDTFAGWGSEDITWGNPRATVAISVDPDRIYDGKRVLHFSRAGGVGEAGVKVRQMTNYVANGLFRIGAVFYKPNANDNQVTLRLRRVSDGVYIHEETFTPTVGFWYEYVTDFIEIPDSTDQIYTVELVLTGDDPDEFYLNDLYTEVAPIRYFMRVGDSSTFLHDVTQLRYADTAIVSTTNPVNEFSIQTVILSPKAYAYGVTATPVYLK